MCVCVRATNLREARVEDERRRLVVGGEQYEHGQRRAGREQPGAAGVRGRRLGVRSDRRARTPRSGDSSVLV